MVCFCVNGVVVLGWGWFLCKFSGLMLKSCKKKLIMFV